MLAGGVTRAFTWSASGNVTVDDVGGSAVTLTYNSADRLVQVGSGGIPLVDYVYSATGQRAIKTTPLATTHYLHDPGGALYAETDGAGATLREYITLGGATIAIIDAGGIDYVHDDHLGTPQVMTDGSAAVVWDASYRPFGEATIAGAAANQQRFPGQTADAETGYHDNWYRTYDSSLGRYLQSDPIGIDGGWNTYAYVGGNPVMLSDRMGLINPRTIPLAGAFVATSAALLALAAGCIDEDGAFDPMRPFRWIPSDWIPNFWKSWRERSDPPASGDNNPPGDDDGPSPIPLPPWQGPGNGDDGNKPFALGVDTQGSLERFAREHNAEYYNDYPPPWDPVVADKLMDPDTDIIVDLTLISDPLAGALRGLAPNPSPMDWELGRIYSGQYQGTITWYYNGAPAAALF